MAVYINTITDLSNLSNLYTLDIIANQITTLNLTGNANLGILRVNTNQLTSLNLNSLVNLTEVNISNNPDLDTLSISTLNSCTYFNGGGCKLSTSIINDILVALDNNGLEGSYYCFLDGGTNGIPSIPGVSAASSLILKGWTVTYNS